MTVVTEQHARHGAILFRDQEGMWKALQAGSAGQVLMTQGEADPEWSSVVTGSPIVLGVSADPTYLAGVSIFGASLTIPAALSHASGLNGVSAVYNDLGTLVSGQTYRGAYFRYNVASTVPSNPAAEVTGIEGVAGSKINDEALTFRGGYFRTYIDTDSAALASMRTAIGCEISARASYSGGTEAVAEAGTAFIGVRIWMAPFFTDASIGNINNFHGLWILNEAAGKLVTNAIKVDATTYGSGFQYLLYGDDGKIRTYLDGRVSGNSLSAGKTSTATGDDLIYVVGEDLRTLTSAQTYRGAYFRYNIRSSTPSNPTCEVTGVEGVVGSYIADESITARGGYFRTYIDANATYTLRTSVGCEISARASYSGGTECAAEAGTAFIGARIWMAPFFTNATFANINNSHALWIISEVPNGGAWAKYVDRAITIDATTYGSGFNYNFYADTGKFYMRLDGSVAGSGVVAGERSAASGDNWMTVQVDDYRTLVTGQTYDAAYFRYNVRSTTPGNPTTEITGVEGVVGWYVNPAANSNTIRGGHFRNYITAGNRVRTAVGVDISSRAGLVADDCAADAGTGFIGARIWMAPYFTAATIGNINNFWGLWIYGEHATQRNADAAIKISDAGGGFTADIAFQEGSTLTDVSGVVITSANSLKLKLSDDTDDFFTLATVSNIPTIYGTGSYVRIGDANASSYASAEDDLHVSGTFDVGNFAYLPNFTLRGQGKINDGISLAFGTSADAYFQWVTGDANANALHLVLPTGDATNVPALILIRTTADTGLYDGLTQPLIAIHEKGNQLHAATDGIADAGAASAILKHVGGFTNAVVGDWVRMTAGTNVTVGWYWITTVTSADQVTLDRNFCTGDTTTAIFVTFHNFPMLGADGVCLKCFDGAPGDANVEIDRDGWLELDVSQANGRLYWRANSAWHYVDASAGLSLPKEERIDPFGHEFQIGDTVKLVVDKINDDGSFHAMPMFSKN